MNFRFPPAPSIGTTMSFSRELRIFDDFARSVNDAVCEVSLIENFLPVRHRL